MTQRSEIPKGKRGGQANLNTDRRHGLMIPTCDVGFDAGTMNANTIAFEDELGPANELGSACVFELGLGFRCDASSDVVFGVGFWILPRYEYSARVWARHIANIEA